MVSAMRRPPSSFTAPQPVSFMTRAAFRKATAGRFFVGAERQIYNHQRALGATHDGRAVHDHQLQGNRHGGLVAVHNVAERIAHKHEVDMAVDHSRGVSMIGRQRDDFLAAFAGLDIGRGEPAHFQVLRHGLVLSINLPSHSEFVRCGKDLPW